MPLPGLGWSPHCFSHTHTPSTTPFHACSLAGVMPSEPSGVRRAPGGCTGVGGCPGPPMGMSTSLAAVRRCPAVATQTLLCWELLSRLREACAASVSGPFPAGSGALAPRSKAASFLLLLWPLFPWRLGLAAAPRAWVLPSNWALAGSRLDPSAFHQPEPWGTLLRAGAQHTAAQAKAARAEGHPPLPQLAPQPRLQLPCPPLPFPQLQTWPNFATTSSHCFVLF